MRSSCLKSQPKVVQIFMKEHGSGLSLDETVKLSELYKDAHKIIAGAMENDDGPRKSKYMEE
jgi:hypothetical protein